MVQEEAIIFWTLNINCEFYQKYEQSVRYKNEGSYCLLSLVLMALLFVLLMPPKPKLFNFGESVETLYAGKYNSNF